MSNDDSIERHRLPFEVFQAEGKLSALLGVSIDQAVISLDLLAQFRGASLAATAREILVVPSAANGVQPKIDNETFAILRQHLDCSSTPLDPALPHFGSDRVGG